ncbi:hypothetical protein OBP_151 [Pseudomonas phage OBP]|uniref:hypothetical protein n=1 Tax=Pseudomonas phage OBP TaxID=1124849 RepID=UPI000240D56C|nr:hypothetical protein OBP_151 [Pseudomonas phage OBP]AEV89588.1 hypothetical protein OBP_151 [Pseudomonas phage OBP]
MEKRNKPASIFIEHPKGFRMDIFVDFTGDSTLTERETIARIARVETCLSKNGMGVVKDSFNIMFDSYYMLMTAIKERYIEDITLPNFDTFTKEDIEEAIVFLIKSDKACSLFDEIFDDDQAAIVH